MIRILSKHAQIKVAIGYTTHNGASRRVCYAPNRELARKAVEVGRVGNTHRKQGEIAKQWLKNQRLAD